jgi:hypothetical protein
MQQFIPENAMRRDPDDELSRSRLETLAKFELETGIGSPTTEGLKRWIDDRRRMESTFSHRIVQCAGVLKALTDLQRRRLPRGEILQALARMAVEVHIYQTSPRTAAKGLRLVQFPSAEGARRANMFANNIRKFVKQMARFQATSVPLQFLATPSDSKTRFSAAIVTGTVQSISDMLETYADFVDRAAVRLRPSTGRRRNEILDDLTRQVVEGVNANAKAELLSTYGMLKPLAVLIDATYKVAGAHRRTSPRALRRLLDNNRT